MHNITLYVGLSGIVIMFTVILSAFEGFITPKPK